MVTVGFTVRKTAAPRLALIRGGVSPTQMPRRTNEFQRLIAAIQGHLDPGSSVAESELLPDRITGTGREVDVVISGKVGSQPVTVSVECRDRARSADVTWVEQMQAKHSRLATNVLPAVGCGA